MHCALIEEFEMTTVQKSCWAGHTRPIYGM